jgi:septal ring factor EnvC (AmiA/AmiB activator)
MAEYPWGSVLPAKRIATIENQIAVNDKKRADLIEAHKTKLAEFDENDRKLKADLRQATTIQEKETREATLAAASKALERFLNSPAANGIDIDELVRKGQFEKMLGDVVASASKATPTKKSDAAEKPADDGASGGETN